MGNPENSIRLFPSYEEVQNREEFFAQVARSYDITTLPLGPTPVYPPMPQSYMAIKDEPEKGAVQLLNGILKAGSYGYGIATAYGYKLDGQSYLVKINDEPYTQETKFLQPLFPSVELTLGGDDGIEPQLGLEGLRVVLRTNEKGQLTVRGKIEGNGKLELLTAKNREKKKGVYNPLENEIQTWSLDSNFLRRALRRSFAPRPVKSSYLKKENIRRKRAGYDLVAA